MYKPLSRVDRSPKAATKIQKRKRKTIIDAALSAFSRHGFRGTTLDRIAENAGMSKPNLLYYFTGKEAIYVAVLEDTLTEWLEPLAALDPAGDPIAEIGRYITAKLRLSQHRPEASRLFANEILHGAPAIGAFLRGPLKALVDDKAKVISGWIAEGRLAPVDPYHLIFMIWAVTQHYADFDAQVRAVLEPNTDGRCPIEAAEPNVARIILDGLRPRQDPPHPG